MSPTEMIEFVQIVIRGDSVQTTGATNSGSEDARRQQEQIIRLLVQRGAKLSDKDAKGKSVTQAATSGWVRELLASYASSGM